MWEVPQYRIRRYVRHLKRTRELARLEPPARPSLHLRRASAEIAVLDDQGVKVGVVPASLLINDLTPSFVTVFSTRPIAVGQEVSLTIPSPRLFYVRGRIASCADATITRNIVSSHSFGYRLAIRFEFESEEEARMILRYCREMRERYVLGNATA